MSLTFNWLNTVFFDYESQVVVNEKSCESQIKVWNKSDKSQVKDK